MIGTWEIYKVVNADGAEIDSYKGLISYSTFLENGILVQFGIRSSFPYTGKEPETVEEYKKIENNTIGTINTYSCDLDNNKITFETKHAIHPTWVGKSMTDNFKVNADTLTIWNDSGEKFIKYIRME